MSPKIKQPCKLNTLVTETITPEKNWRIEISLLGKVSYFYILFYFSPDIGGNVKWWVSGFQLNTTSVTSFVLLYANFGCWPRAVTTSNMEFFMKIVVAPKLVAIATKSSLNLSCSFGARSACERYLNKNWPQFDTLLHEVCLPASNQYTY